MFKAAAWVYVCRRNGVHRGGHLLPGYILGKHAVATTTRQHHQHPAMMLRPGSPHSGPAVRRPRPGRARPGAVVRRSSRDTRSVTDNQQPGVHQGAGCTSSWHVCNRNPLWWLPAERYSKMTETPQPIAPPSAATTSPPPSRRQRRPPRLYRAAALGDRGQVFSPVAVIFFWRVGSGGGNALTTAITTTAYFRPVGPGAVQGWDGCSGSPADPLPQAWAPVS